MHDDIAGTTEWGTDDLIKFKPLFFGGHCLYVRKCERPEQVDGIYLTERQRETCYWVEVLARGPMVGKQSTKAHAKRYKRARWFGDAIEIGMLVLIPNETSLGIKDSPFRDYEKFIEESLPVLYYDPAGAEDVS